MGAKTTKTLMTMMVLAAGFLVLPYAAEAHHGWAEFDEGSDVTYEGTVRDFHFTNPHCVVEFDTKDAKGQVRKMEGEFASPPELARKGWTAATLQTGDKITISGHPAKSGAPAIHVTAIKGADGKELKLYNGR